MMANVVDVISDASPLIYFAKMAQLEFLAQVIGSVAIPPAVYREAVEVGQELGYRDADRIVAAIGAGWIVPVELTGTELQMADEIGSDPRLGPGECETIACAVCRRWTALLHDRRARHLAAVRGVRTMQAVDVLFLALLRRHFSLDKFKRLLSHLAAVSGMDAATRLEREVLAEEIAIQLELRRKE